MKIYRWADIKNENRKFSLRELKHLLKKYASQTSWPEDVEKDTWMFLKLLAKEPLPPRKKTSLDEFMEFAARTLSRIKKESKINGSDSGTINRSIPTDST